MEQSKQARRDAVCHAAEERSRLAKIRYTTAGARSAAIAAVAAADGAIANAAIVAKGGGGGAGDGGGGGGRGGGGDSDKRLKMTQISRQQEETRTLELAKRTSLYTEQPHRGCDGLLLTRKHNEEKPMFITYTEPKPPFKIVLEELVHAPMLLKPGITELECEENRCSLSYDGSCDKYDLTLKRGHMEKNTLDVIVDVMVGNSVTVCGDDEVSLGPNCHFKIAPTKIMPPKHCWQKGGQGGAL